MTFLVQRGEDEVPLQVVPAMLERATYDEEGNPITKDGGLVLDSMGFMGITPGSELVTKPLAEAPGFVWDRTLDTASIIWRIPEKMVGVAQAAFGSGERDPNGPSSRSSSAASAGRSPHSRSRPTRVATGSRSPSSSC